jgi:hypothetical protein
MWSLGRFWPGMRDSSFFGCDLGDSAFHKFRYITGLGVPANDERRLLGESTCVERILRASIALCPICSHSGYHTFWFQLPFLNVCPLHNVPLIERCANCGSRMARYAFSRDLFRPAWGCPCCHQPMAGMWPDLREYVDLRRHASELNEAFAPLEEWLLSVKKRGVSLNEVQECCGDERSMKLADAVCSVLAPPFVCSLASTCRIHILTWYLKLRPRRPPRRKEYHVTRSLWLAQFAWDNRGRPPAGGFNGRGQATATRVYYATCRRIQRWLIDRHARLNLNTDLNAVPVVEGKSILTRGWDRCELAYVLFRWWIEGAWYENGAVFSPINRKIALRKIPSCACVGNRVLRLPCRAAYVAAYARVVAMLQFSTEDGRLSFNVFHWDIMHALRYDWRYDFLRHAGLILMPPVENLLDSFPELHGDISSAWARHWDHISRFGGRLPCF